MDLGEQGTRGGDACGAASGSGLAGSRPGAALSLSRAQRESELLAGVRVAAGCAPEPGPVSP